LHDHQAAEDVFQRTFLTLARKASSLVRSAGIAGWLYRVALHSALEARTQATRRQHRESQVVQSAPRDPLAELTGRELLTLLDEELQGLEDRHRLPLVYCYLEGRTCDEAARQLGWPPRTFDRRLQEARDRLRRRLERRGVELPAVLLAGSVSLTAAVPRALASTIVQAAVSGVAAPSRGLGWIAVLLLAGSMVAFGVGTVWGTSQTSVPPRPAAAQPDSPASPKRAPQVADKRNVTVEGRILDSAGKPASAAPVAILTQTWVPMNGVFDEVPAHPPQVRVLASTKADDQGHYRFELSGNSLRKYDKTHVVSGGPDHALSWRELNCDSDNQEADVTLQDERTLRGRLLDLQGQPLTGAHVRVQYLGRSDPGKLERVGLPGQEKDLPWAPAPVRTGTDGTFAIKGIGPGVKVRLIVEDPNHGFQYLSCDNHGKEFSRALAPAQVVRGVVRYADTGKAVANGRVVISFPSASVIGRASVANPSVPTDAQGRFRFHLPLDPYAAIAAYPPEGEPYLGSVLYGGQGTVKQPEIELKLYPGVMVKGKVTEAGSGKPVAGTWVQYVARRDNPNGRPNIVLGSGNHVLSGPDGSFRLCVLPGQGHLLIHGPTSHFLLREKTEGELSLSGKPGGSRSYANAFVPLDVKPDASPEVAVALRRGASVRVHLTDPEGQAVTEVQVISPLLVGPDGSIASCPARRISGPLEFRGLDPEKTYPVLFFDAKNLRGATVELSAKQADEPVTVRLLPCGTATLRLLDAEGNPTRKMHLELVMVVTPGATAFGGMDQYLAAPAEDHVNMWEFAPVYYGKGLRVDSEGA
jgi:RNA polymerase sigma factor (sigma-70 family)